MTVNGNSVNIKGDKRYHHGELRSALIAQGLQLLATNGVADLSLRAMARAVGVSPTAVYRHFPDKEALLGTLCSEGGRLLADAQRQAFAQAGGGGTGVVATGRAYVRFAIENPALFRLMMTGQSPRGGSEGLSLLRAHIREAAMRASPQGEAKWRAATGFFAPVLGQASRARAEADADDADDADDAEQFSHRVMRAWALVHGLAMLILDGQIPADSDLIDALIVTTP